MIKDELDTAYKRLTQLLSNKNLCLKIAYDFVSVLEVERPIKLSLSQVTIIVNNIYKQIGLMEVDEEFVKPIFDKYDASCNGYLHFDEFVLFFWKLIFHVRSRFFSIKSYPIYHRDFHQRNYIDKLADLENYYDNFTQIGAGSFGKVYLVREKCSRQNRVCKSIPKSKAVATMQQIEVEIAAMRSLSHPNIVKLYDIYEDPKHIHLIIDYCSGGELFGNIRKAQGRHMVLNEVYAREIMKQVFSALAYIHYKKILHKDLKPENIMVINKKTNKVALIDFGLSELFKDDQFISTIPAGTVTYMAPEVFISKLNFKSDIWSAGVLMYVLMTGYLPFSGSTISEIRSKVFKYNPDYNKRCKHLSRHAINLIQHCLTKKVSDRYTAEQCLNHPWFGLPNSNKVTMLPLDVCNNLLHFSKLGGLRITLYNLLAFNTQYTDNNYEACADLFINLLGNQKGEIDSKDLQQILINSGMPACIANQVVVSLDVDLDGYINFTEFISGSVIWTTSYIDEIRALYLRMCDMNTDLLTAKRLASYITNSETFNKQSYLSLMDDIKNIPQQHYGEITWPEFFTFMRK